VLEKPKEQKKVPAKPKSNIKKPKQHVEALADEFDYLNKISS
jgi:hypothetical protein